MVEKKKKVRIFSAGGVIYKPSKNKRGLLFLITKSSPSQFIPESYWRLPKGWIDDQGDYPGPYASGKLRASESIIKKAALREVAEEGGVKAKIKGKIGTFKWFTGRNEIKFVTFYLMEFLKNLRQGFGKETEKVGWFSYKKARSLLKFERERIVLDKAREMLLKKEKKI